MFSAVSNLGAGGTQDVSLSDTSNGVLYGLFAVTGVLDHLFVQFKLTVHFRSSPGLVSGGINNSKYQTSFSSVSDN